MTISNSAGRLGTRHPQPAAGAAGPPLVFAGALVLAFTAALLASQALPGDALLPAISMLFWLLAAIVALVAWRSPAPDRNVSYWDVAGAFVFIGVCIAALVEPEQLVRLVAGTHSKD
jgi:hypothetical protein